VGKRQASSSPVGQGRGSKRLPDAFEFEQQTANSTPENNGYVLTSVVLEQPQNKALDSTVPLMVQAAPSSVDPRLLWAFSPYSGDNPLIQQPPGNIEVAAQAHDVTTTGPGSLVFSDTSTTSGADRAVRPSTPTPPDTLLGAAAWVINSLDDGEEYDVELDDGSLG
jgi:hypothetical protein